MCSGDTALARRKWRGRVKFRKLEALAHIPMKTLEQTTGEILDLAAAHFKVARAELSPSDDFYKKLGIDSLQALELLSRIENHFGVELPDYEVQGVSDFQTLAARIQSRL